MDTPTDVNARQRLMVHAMAVPLANGVILLTTLADGNQPSTCAVVSQRPPSTSTIVVIVDSFMTTTAMPTATAASGPHLLLVPLKLLAVALLRKSEKLCGATTCAASWTRAFAALTAESVAGLGRPLMLASGQVIPQLADAETGGVPDTPTDRTYWLITSVRLCKV